MTRLYHIFRLGNRSTRQDTLAKFTSMSLFNENLHKTHALSCLNDICPLNLLFHNIRLYHSNNSICNSNASSRDGIRSISDKIFLGRSSFKPNAVFIPMQFSPLSMKKSSYQSRNYSTSDEDENISTEKLLDSVLQDRLKAENVQDFQRKHPEIYGRIAKEALDRVKKDKTVSLEDALKEKVTYEMQKDSYRKEYRPRSASSKARDLSKMDSYRPREAVPKKDEYRYKKVVEKAKAYAVKRPTE